MGAANLQWITGNVFGPLLGGVLLDQLLGYNLRCRLYYFWIYLLTFRQTY
ncbi:hypothetical protein BAWI5_20795 [Bacillus wiedmannii]